MRAPERSRGRVDASCGASNPALARPRNDGARVFNQLRLPLALVRLFDALLADKNGAQGQEKTSVKGDLYFVMDVPAGLALEMALYIRSIAGARFANDNSSGQLGLSFFTLTLPEVLLRRDDSMF